MDIPEHTTPYSWRGCLFTMVAIVVGIFACSLTVNVVVDGACVDGATTWLPDYPEAALIEESYTFIRMWGIGTSRRVLFTEDDVLDVRSWYRQSDTENSRANARRGGANVNWRADEAEGGGTVITLVSQCARELDLSVFGLGGGGLN